MSAVLPERHPSRVDVLRQPPFSLEAEQSVLGGVMLVPDALAQISDWLTVEDFHRRDHRLIYAAILKLADRREPLDAVTLLQRLEADAERDQVAVPYLYELMNNTPSAANVAAWAEIVVEKSKLRKLIDIGTQLAGNGFDPRTQSELAIANGIRDLSLIQTSRLRGGLRSSRDLCGEWYAEIQANYEHGNAITGMATPWTKLDLLTHGLQAGDLIVIAARPNMGKTVMAVQAAVHAAIALNRQVALFSMEMTAKQILNRAAACMGSVPHKWLLAPHHEKENWAKVGEIVTQLNRAPLWIDDTPGLTIDQIKARARRTNLRSKIGLLMVDHLGEVRLRSRTSSDRAYELGDVAGELKGLGKEFDCPVVALAQLNRELLKRDDKHPNMGDLRASGDIEQKADLILFLHREDYYNKNTHLKGVVDVEIGKGRNIPSFERIQLANHFDVMRMDDWEGDLPLPPPPQTKSKKRNSFVPDPVAEAYAE